MICKYIKKNYRKILLFVNISKLAIIIEISQQIKTNEQK